MGEYSDQKLDDYDAIRRLVEECNVEYITDIEENLLLSINETMLNCNEYETVINFSYPPDMGGICRYQVYLVRRSGNGWIEGVESYYTRNDGDIIYNANRKIDALGKELSRYFLGLYCDKVNENSDVRLDSDDLWLH